MLRVPRPHLRGLAQARDDGVIVCPACLEPEPLDVPETDPAVELGVAPPPAAPSALSAISNAAAYCRLHPDVPAVARCRDCGAPVCSTCVFSFPGYVYLCPACATNPKQKLAPKRKMLTGWSIGLGAVNFLASAGLLIASITLARNRALRDEASLQAIGCFAILVLGAAVTGFILGLSAYRRGARNRLYLLIGPILNGLVTGFWVLCMIVGLSRQH